MDSENGFNGLRERIASLIGDEEPFKWAKRAGIAPATFDRLWNGGAMPKVETLVRISAKTGASLDWLVRGEGALSAPATSAGGTMDEELMGRVTDAIVRLYKEERVSLAPIDLGRLSARKYDEIVATAADADERAAMLKLVITQLRNELRSASVQPGTGKRSA
ncbi:helix-turn-helix domain-containing protein [Xanthobacter flavus]|uniref:helix-turn-helix domain-containing protein n=1 Tax=Xanthobacter flavus TaxID=281 RepID=UPI00372873FA